MTMAPNGNLLVVNGLDGQVVEIDPVAGKQIGTRGSIMMRRRRRPAVAIYSASSMNPDGQRFLLC